ncbi:PAS domain S-box protein [Mucilaginibacter conchicola]|uniref:histidine kinase n=1 Tax=Mucilaginibacter conchicola TaxID=2303333 RepID=A0A372NW88_9SPHI|nr:ATP-binding protein [Mucilaginibacter conchicola]RFZ92897.1 PAS domain S-box protein [Mucilaginibacter conchicola]
MSDVSTIDRILSGGDHTGAIIQNIDWSITTIGSPDTWPDSLVSALSVGLYSGFPIAIYWGADFTLLYNDAWSSIPGDKHPWALGKPGAVVWPEIWDGLREEFETVLHEGRSYRRPDALLLMHRYGYTEECYFDYTLSPIISREGEIGGVYNAVIETTFKVIQERRNKVISEFIQHKYLAHHQDEALQFIGNILTHAAEDIPFYMLYIFPGHVGRDAELTAYGNITKASAKQAKWPATQPSDDGSPVVITDLRQYLREEVVNFWPEPVSEAVLLPISKDEASVKGFVVFGASARKRLDDAYITFLQTVAIHTGSLLNNAAAYETNEAYHREQALNEELAAANEELTAINEELVQTQTSLNELNQELEERVETRTLEVLTAQAAAVTERDRLKRFLMDAPAAICILNGPEMNYELVNASYQQLLPERQLLGLPILQALPEIEDQPIWDVLHKVYQTGEAYHGNEVPVAFISPDGGTAEERYFNFTYQAKHGPDKVVDGIMVFAFEVTDMVRSRQLVEESYAQLQALNEEVAATNEELAATNEELITTNEDLYATKAELEKSISELEASENRFRALIQHAPVAIAVVNGPDLILETANTARLELWGKTKDVIGLKLKDALPEMAGQHYLQILSAVYETGRTYHGNESRAFVERNGVLTEGFYNFVYEPIQDGDGQVTGIILVTIDVTQQVQARKALEGAQDTLKFAFVAAELGTFDLDLDKGTLSWDDRCRELFGVSHHNEVTYEKDFVNGLHPDDRERIVEIINNVFVRSISNGDYDVEYRTVGAEDERVRWVRAKGKAYFDENDKPLRFVGAVLDITEQKLDEIRKNDFIGMVSHELKTPLTSLSAYVQVLLSKARKGEDKFTLDALTKTSQQAKKMSNMINGFLNISRFESGKIHLEKSTFELDSLVKDAIDETLLVVSSHTITLLPCQPIQVYADGGKISSVVTNLLSNAVKYSPRGTNIEVSCIVTGSMARVNVRDEGIGISPQDQEKLFDRYYRVESKQARYVSGFGIGLYLSAEIIHRHDGEISVESEPGKGSTFWFTLPVGA